MSTASVKHLPGDHAFSCWICGQKAQRLLHPDEMGLAEPPAAWAMLCHFCHRPACPKHLSTERIERLERIRPQAFCTECGDRLKETRVGPI